MKSSLVTHCKRHLFLVEEHQFIGGTEIPEVFASEPPTADNVSFGIQDFLSASKRAYVLLAFLVYFLCVPDHVSSSMRSFYWT